MRPLLLAILAVLLALFMAALPALAQPADGVPSAEVTVARDGDAWTAVFHLLDDAPVWAFVRSGVTRNGGAPWRPQAWTVKTQGVRLARRGHYDVFEATDGGDVPREVRIRFTPFSADLVAEYEPALVFTDGAVALFTDQFDMFALDSAAAVEALPMDLNGVDIGPMEARVTFRDHAGPVQFAGERHDQLTLAAGQGYVLFGSAEVVDSAHLSTVLDPGLPEWVRAELAAYTPRLLDLYAAELGPGEGRKPTIMASWAGPTPGLQSMGGSVLPGLVIMTFEGVGVLERTPDVRDGARWFIAHEAAHFWLGQVVRYERARDAWITEGAADLLALRALKRLDPEYDALGALQAEVDDCIRYADEPVAQAAERGENRAFYACGAVFGLIAEAASDDDWFGFLRPLIAANREDAVLTRAEWLDELTRRSGDASLAADIEGLLDEGAADPAAAVAGLLTRSDVAFSRDETGAVRLL